MGEPRSPSALVLENAAQKPVLTYFRYWLRPQRYLLPSTPTVIPRSSFDYDYEHEHRCAEHESSHPKPLAGRAATAIC